MVVYKAISAGGGMLVGKLVTRELVMKMLRLVGVRLTAQQAAKYVPIAGQAVSAALTFSSLRFVCEQHIQQCASVARQLILPARRRPTSTALRTSPPRPIVQSRLRGVAQPGSAPGLGPVGREFESHRPDHRRGPRAPRCP